MSWIKLHRSLVNWKFRNNLRHYRVWIQMLIEANYVENKFEGETIKRGELVFTYRTWAKKFRDCKPPINKSHLETIIRNFKLSGQIRVRKTLEKKISIIKIVNYESYQAGIDENFRTVTQGKLGQGEGKTRTVTQNVKNENKTDESSFCKEEQLDMFLEQDKLSDTLSDTSLKNSDSNAPKIETTIINKKNKYINNYKKEELYSHFNKKYSKVFLSDASNIQSRLNEYLSSVNMQQYSMLDEKEFLRPLRAAFKEFKCLDDYYLVMEYCFNAWNGKQFADGTEMIQNFTPETLFKRNMGKYIRKAKNAANRPNRGPEKATHDETIDLDELLRQEEEKEAAKQKEIAEKERALQEEREKEHLLKLEEEEKLLKEGKILSF